MTMSREEFQEYFDNYVRRLTKAFSALQDSAFDLDGVLSGFRAAVEQAEKTAKNVTASHTQKLIQRGAALEMHNAVKDLASQNVILVHDDIWAEKRKKKAFDTLRPQLAKGKLYATGPVDWITKADVVPLGKSKGALVRRPEGDWTLSSPYAARRNVVEGLEWTAKGEQLHVHTDEGTSTFTGISSGNMIEIQALTEIKVKVDKGEADEGKVTVTNTKDMEKMLSGGETALIDFMEKNKRSIEKAFSVPPPKTTFNNVDYARLETISFSLNEIANADNLDLFFNGDIMPDCDECFGTGLKGGFQSPCSRGCEQR